MEYNTLLTAVPQAEKILNKPTSPTVREGTSNKDLSEGEIALRDARHSSGEYNDWFRRF